MKKTIITIALIALATTSSVLAAPKVTKVSLESKGEENVYKGTAKITAPAGGQVDVTFKNNSTSMPHNFVLTKPGKGDAVGIASLSAGEANDWVKVTPDVIFHSKLVKPKSTEKFTFTAPTEKGDYPFVCTFPGHYSTMKGVLTVK